MQLLNISKQRNLQIAVWPKPSVTISTVLLKIRRHYYSVHTVYTEYNIVYSVEYILTLVFSQPPLPDKFRAPKVGRVFTKLELKLSSPPPPPLLFRREKCAPRVMLK